MPAPNNISLKKYATSSQPVNSCPPTIEVKVIVRKYAMGSLLPLSNSNKGRKRPFKPTLFERRIENTAAASVEDTIAPSSKASAQLKSAYQCTKLPTEPAVMNTPSVDNNNPSPITGFTSSRRV